MIERALRICRVEVRVTEQEKGTIERVSAAHGLSVSEWLRLCALAGVTLGGPTASPSSPSRPPLAPSSR